MFLSENIYIGANYKHNNVEGIIDITIRGKKVDIPFNRVQEIVLAKGYWRKANHIHNWFVEKIQSGEDDCKNYYVDYEQLEELKRICERVKESLDNSSIDESGNYIDTEIAENLLPTQSGFFFGSTGYDEYYYDGLVKTIKILSDLNEDSFYYYSSSW